MSIVTGLWAQQPGDYFFISTKSATGGWIDKPFKRSEFGKVDAFIRDQGDKDVYFCPHGFSKPRRLKEYAVLPRMLWSDMDEVNPAKCPLKPTIAIESSPGRYVGLWLVDDEVTEAMNKRLSYFLGCDKGGWDLTQVLRVPRTVNHKYVSKPKVRLLWDDGPTYKVALLDAKLPEVKIVDREKVKLADRLPAVDDIDLGKNVRRALNAVKHMADRSARLMHVARAMVKDEHTPDEIAAVLLDKGHVVSEHAYEQQNPRRAVARAIGAAQGEMHSESDSEGPSEGTGYKMFGRTLAEVEPEQIDWLWFPYLARGEVTIVEGDPNVGKSYLIQMVARHFCDGLVLPSKRRLPAVKGKVFVADCENTVASVTVNRMIWNGIRCRENFTQEDEPFTIDDRKKMRMMYEAIERERPVLVVFDTVNLYIGGADTAKASETTQAMGAFKDIAKRFNCAVVVVRHLTKGTKDKALYRGQGSIAFAGVARIVLTCGTDPEDEETHILTVNKMNLGKKPPALEYRIDAAPTLDDLDRSVFSWGDFNENLTSEEAIAPTKKSTVIEAAQEWLRQELEAGPQEASRLEAKAEAHSISRPTLYRAAKKLGVIRDKRSETGNMRDRTVFWALPNLKKPQ